MSKYMQIDITIKPVYKKKFSKQFSNLSRVLKNLGYRKSVEKEPCFYELVDTFESIMRNKEISDFDKERLQPFYVKLKELKKEAIEFLLARKLDKLDKVLYQLEDTFQELEKELRYW